MLYKTDSKDSVDLPKETISERRSLATQSQWFIKAPTHPGYFDRGFKVLPSMNYPQRIKTLEHISKENLWLYDKLQNVKSTINTKELLDKNQQQLRLRTRIKVYGPDGLKKKDPLIRMMQNK